MEQYAADIDNMIAHLSPRDRMRLALRLIADYAQALTDLELSIRCREVLIILRGIVQVHDLRSN